MKAASRVTQKYIIFAALWILLSDRAVELFSTSLGQMALYSTIKGLVFVLVTSLFLYFWVKDEIREKNKAIEELDGEIRIREQLIRELHHRIKNNLQVVIGLLNIAAMDRYSVQDLKDRITSKLVSMIAVFNIVYDMRDMKNISLAKVVDEYKRISIRNIEEVEIDPEIAYSIETITSCLLLLDTVIEGILAESFTEKVSISVLKKGEIRIRVPGIDDQPNAIQVAKDGLVDVMLSAVQGTMALGKEELIITIKEENA